MAAQVGNLETGDCVSGGVAFEPCMNTLAQEVIIGIPHTNKSFYWRVGPHERRIVLIKVTFGRGRFSVLPSASEAG